MNFLYDLLGDALRRIRCDALRCDALRYDPTYDRLLLLSLILAY